MDKSDYFLSAEYPARLEKGSFIIEEEIRDKLKAEKPGRVILAVYKNVRDELNNSGLDAELFGRIEKTQRLPANVVLDFLSIKGEIHDNDFLDRLKNA